MKALLITIAVSNIFALQSASAEGVCNDSNREWNGSRCVTVGTSAAGAIASGIYAVKKYSGASSIETEFTQRIFEHSEMKPGTKANSMFGMGANITDGDRVTISYNLSETENRAYHVDLMESNASSARSSAISYGAMALTATTTETVSDGKGGTTTRTVPDYAARIRYAAMAASSYSEARDYDAKAENARRGGPVPMYEHQEVVDKKAGTSKLALDVVNERIRREGTILHIDRLPVEKFNIVKNMVWKARGGVVGAVVGVGLGAEEAIAGHVARTIDNSSYRPQMRSYGTTRNGTSQ